MDFLRVGLALMTVFGLLGILYVMTNAARRRTVARGSTSVRTMWPRKLRVAGNGEGSKHLELIRRVHLTPTHQLHLISTTQEIFLVCTHPNGCTLLRARDVHAAITEESAAPAGLEQYAS
jgi:hypothetical protein